MSLFQQTAIAVMNSSPQFNCRIKKQVSLKNIQVVVLKIIKLLQSPILSPHFRIFGKMKWEVHIKSFCYILKYHGPRKIIILSWLSSFFYGMPFSLWEWRTGKLWLLTFSYFGIMNGSFSLLEYQLILFFADDKMQALMRKLILTDSQYRQIFLVSTVVILTNVIVW